MTVATSDEVGDGGGGGGGGDGDGSSGDNSNDNGVALNVYGQASVANLRFSPK